MNLQSEKDTYLGSGKNVEIVSDDFSHFRFTKLIIEIPCSSQVIDESNILTDYADTILNVINKFVDACRIVLQRYGLSSYHDFSQFLDVTTTVKPSSHLGVGYHRSLQGGIVNSIRNHGEEEHKEIQRILNSNIPPHHLFLLDAKRFVYHKDYLTAQVLMVTALEMAINLVINKVATLKNINKCDLDEYIHNVGLTGNIKVTFRLILPDKTLPEDSIFNECKGAITIRNKIVHDGLRLVIKEEIDRYMMNVEKMISYCNGILA